MSTPARSTAQLQNWMLTVITHTGGVEAGVGSDEARRLLPVDESCLEDVILPSSRQTSLERLAVYGNAYYARLLHCLRELFPACRQAVGDDIFDEFALAYLERYPPQSYTLGVLADRFVDFLDSSRAAHIAAEPGEEVESWSRFLVELAQLEHTIDQVFDGPGLEREPPIVAEQLAAAPAAGWETMRLVPAASLRLLACEFPVNEYYSAFRRGDTLELPAARPSYLAITRRDYVVRRHTLDATQFRLLSSLARGASLGEALAVAASQDDDFERLSKSLAAWFSTWARELFFARLEFST